MICKRNSQGIHGSTRLRHFLSSTLTFISVLFLLWVFLLTNTFLNDNSLETKQSTSTTSQRRLKSTSFELNEVSPYEAIWRGYHLPGWAKKEINYQVDEEMCFVHVGKAGGSSVGCHLGFSLHCDKNVKVQGLLPKTTTHIFHKDVYNCKDDSAYFLFIVRDPIDRIRSAFNYGRPELASDDSKYIRRMKEFYVDCPFWTLEQLSQNSLNPLAANVSDACRDKAIASLQGTKRYASHLYFNYQYYFQAVPENASIFVIRNEHLVEDWNTIEKIIGGEKDSMASVHRYNANSDTGDDDLFLSSESNAFLCKALCNEIQFYKTILRRALNLSILQLETSLDELKAKCPRETIYGKCPQAPPDISRKLHNERGYFHRA